MSFIPSGGLFPSALADFLAAVTNEASAFKDVSPGAVEIENELIR